MRSLLFLLLFSVSAFQPFSVSAQSTGDVLLGSKSASGGLTSNWITKTPSRALGWDASGVLGPIALGSGSGGTWGSITGTLSSQTDLATALSARLAAASNLSDLASAATARTNLGLGTLATQSATISDYLTSATAATTYAPLASPTFTGSATIPKVQMGATTGTTGTIALISSGSTGYAADIVSNAITGTALHVGIQAANSTAISTHLTSGGHTIFDIDGTQDDGTSNGIYAYMAGPVVVACDVNFNSRLSLWAGKLRYTASNERGPNRIDLVSADPTGSRVITLPDTTGTVVTTGNLSDITSLGTIATGTWQGTAVGIGYGGTGATTASAARIALLPSMTANGGKFLRVNAGATDYELATISGGGDAVVSGTLDQFADVTQTATKTLAITESTTLAGGTHSGTNTGDQATITGNAGTATALQTARTINGTSFDGTANITIAAAAGTLTGSTLASGVTASSLTSFGASPALGTPSSGTMTNVSGTAASLTAGQATAALGIKTSTTTVAVSSATAPTSGQVLTATSSTAANWQTPSGGGGSANWILMSTTTLSSNSSVTLALDGYRRYQIEFESVLCSLDGYTLQMQVSNDAGSTWNTGASDYDWGASKVGSYTDASGTGAFIRLTYFTGNGTGEGISGVLTVLGANDPALQFRVLGKLMEPAYNSASVFGWDIVGRRAATSDVDAVKIYFSNGTLLSGKIRVFGWSE